MSASVRMESIKIKASDYETYNNTMWLKKKHGILIHHTTSTNCRFSSSYNNNNNCKTVRSDQEIIIIVKEEAEEAEENHYCAPSLSYELEDEILARFPRAEYWKLCFLNRRCRALVSSGELFKIRREIGFQEPSVFMLASGDSNTWWAFDRQFKSCRRLPDIPTADDPYFRYADNNKESLCAGTHLLVSGWDADDHQVIWRYDLVTDQWDKAPSMHTPRCLFASATSSSSSSYAYVAGGINGLTQQACDSAERYNSDTNSWETLPRMNRRRKLCSGFYMDNKFYVVGGRNEEEGELTCGEYFDEANNRWELIPDMMVNYPGGGRSPLLAVVNNELYSLEAASSSSSSCSNQLKVYSKKTNTWKKLLGTVLPVKVDCHKGWGVAFKSLGNDLLIIGASLTSPAAAASLAIYTCSPNPDDDQLHWRPLHSRRDWFSNFILNCSVMMA